MRIVFGIVIGAILGTGVGAWAMSPTVSDQLARDQVRALSDIAKEMRGVRDAIKDSARACR